MTLDHPNHGNPRLYQHELFGQPLRAHFDDSYRRLGQLLDEAEQALEDFSADVESRLEQLANLHTERGIALADDASTSEYRQMLRSFLEAGTEAIKRRRSAMLTALDDQQLPRIDNSFWDEVSERVDEYNTQLAERRAGLDHLRRDAADDLLGHLAAIRENEWRLISTEASEAAEQLRRHREELDALRGQVEELRFCLTDQLDGDKVARQLTRDLSVYLGHGELTVEFQRSQDQTGFFVRRHGEPALNLSDGERNAIALLYFIQSLETHDTAPTLGRACIVIDDPVSSMDDDAVISALSFLDYRLRDTGGALRCAQVIILTHNFHFFRLCKDRLSSQRGADNRAARDAGVELVDLPLRKTSLVECFVQVGGDGGLAGRRPALRELSENHELLQSEYFLLFSRACDSLTPDGAHLTVLIGNGVRRLLECFLRFKQPSIDDPQAALRAVESGLDERELDSLNLDRAYKTLNEASHLRSPDVGGRAPSPAVLEDVRQVLRLIRASDPDHFEGMCSATRRSPAL